MATNKKSNFEIYGLENIERLLVQGKLLLPEEELDSIIRKNTDLPFGERNLLFFKLSWPINKIVESTYLK
jgi:hypothetical protein